MGYKKINENKKNSIAFERVFKQISSGNRHGTKIKTLVSLVRIINERKLFPQLAYVHGLDGGTRGRRHFIRILKKNQRATSAGITPFGLIEMKGSGKRRPDRSHSLGQVTL